MARSKRPYRTPWPGAGQGVSRTLLAAALIFLVLAAPAEGRPKKAGAKPPKARTQAVARVEERPTSPCWSDAIAGFVDERLRPWRDVPAAEPGLPDDLVSFLRGVRAVAERRWSEAASAFEATARARSTPLGQRARLVLPEALLRAGLPRAALKAVDDALERGPDLPWVDDLRLVRAASLGALGDAKGAARELRQIDPSGHASDRLARVTACLPPGALPSREASAPSGLDAARAAFRRGRWERAIELFRAVVSGPGGAASEREALAVEGRSMFRLGRLAEAHRAYATLWRRFRARPGLSWAMKTAFMLGEHALGLDLARAYQKTAGDPASARLRVIEVLITFGRYPEALDLYAGHLRALPPRKKPSARTADEAWRLGWLLLRTGQHERALAALEVAYAKEEHEKARQRVRYWLARVREARGDAARADRDYRIVAGGPDPWYRLLATSRLAEAGPLAQPRCEGARLVAAGVDLDALSRMPRRADDLLDGGRVHGVPESPDGRAARFLLGHGLPGVAKDYERRIVNRFPPPSRHRGTAHRRSKGAPSPARRAPPRAASPEPAAWVPLLAALGDEAPLQRYLDAWRALTATAAPASRETAGLPLAYREQVLAAARTERVDPFLLWAVAARESAFDERVVSPAGALGLFQIMPETGARLAAVLEPEADGPWDASRLFEPDTAVRFGARYMRLLLDRFGGQEPLAVAAYNAGPNYLAAWVRQKPGAPLDAFVEEIPFDENRAYVKRVVGTWVAYRERYGDGPLYLANGIDATLPEGVSY